MDPLLHLRSSSRDYGGNDFAGQWLDTIYLQQHADMTLRLGNQTLHIDYPSAGQHIDAPLDGVEAAVRGSYADGTTFAHALLGDVSFFL